MRQNGGEFGELHPADEIKKVVGGIYNGYDHAKEGDD